MVKKGIVISLISVLIVVTILGACFFMFNYFYPVLYKEQIEVNARENNIDKYLVYAVINAESRFDRTAKSRMGAMGLMQLMPKTASYVCELNNIEFKGELSLFEPDINIKLGCLYLKYLLDKFDKDIKLTLMAYNAGENKVKEWIRSGDLDVSAYPETLNYYKKVIKKQKVYTKIV